jgi:hypothetical protein
VEHDETFNGRRRRESQGAAALWVGSFDLDYWVWQSE